LPPTVFEEIEVLRAIVHPQQSALQTPQVQQRKKSAARALSARKAFVFSRTMAREPAAYRLARTASTA
jgi:hypothetical protein